MTGLMEARQVWQQGPVPPHCWRVASSQTADEIYVNAKLQPLLVIQYVTSEKNEKLLGLYLC